MPNPNKKITELATLANSSLAANDMLVVVDVSDTTMDPDGTNKQLRSDAFTIPGGSGSPTGVVTPTTVAQLYKDNVNGALYISVGLTSADWWVLGGVDPSYGSTRGISFVPNDAIYITGERGGGVFIENDLDGKVLIDLYQSTDPKFVIQVRPDFFTINQWVFQPDGALRFDPGDLKDEALYFVIDGTDVRGSNNDWALGKDGHLYYKTSGTWVTKDAVPASNETPFVLTAQAAPGSTAQFALNEHAPAGIAHQFGLPNATGNTAINPPSGIWWYGVEFTIDDAASQIAGLIFDVPNSWTQMVMNVRVYQNGTLIYTPAALNVNGLYPGRHHLYFDAPYTHIDTGATYRLICTFTNDTAVIVPDFYVSPRNTAPLHSGANAGLSGYQPYGTGFGEPVNGADGVIDVIVIALDQTPPVVPIFEIGAFQGDGSYYARMGGANADGNSTISMYREHSIDDQDIGADVFIQARVDVNTISLASLSTDILRDGTLGNAILSLFTAASGSQSQVDLHARIERAFLAISGPAGQTAPLLDLEVANVPVFVVTPNAVRFGVDTNDKSFIGMVLQPGGGGGTGSDITAESKFDLNTHADIDLSTSIQDDGTSGRAGLVLDAFTLTQSSHASLRAQIEQAWLAINGPAGQSLPLIDVGVNGTKMFRVADFDADGNGYARLGADPGDGNSWVQMYHEAGDGLLLAGAVQGGAQFDATHSAHFELQAEIDPAGTNSLARLHLAQRSDAGDSGIGISARPTNTSINVNCTAGQTLPMLGISDSAALLMFGVHPDKIRMFGSIGGLSVSGRPNVAVATDLDSAITAINQMRTALDALGVIIAV